MTSSPSPSSEVPAAGAAVVVGGGPAGLMAAEVLAAAGCPVDLYDAMPSVGRKFLLAGKGGLNLTHSEPIEPFLSRYGSRREPLAGWLAGFDPQALRDWAQGLGVSTFVGSSGRVFPAEMKAAPLLRSWLQRLRGSGVRLHMRHRWLGWAEDGRLRFAGPAGELRRPAGAVVLALGGASWPRLGSDAAWVPWLQQRGIEVAPLQPANCGFDVAGRAPGSRGWTEHFRSRHAGEPLKSVVLAHAGADGGEPFRRQGEFVVTDSGIEGSLVYAASARLRDEIAQRGEARIELDLMPGWEPARVLAEVTHPRGSRSLSSHLQSRLSLKGVKMGLLRELLPAADFNDPARLARAIKQLPLTLAAPRPVEEAISSAGGVRLEGLDEHLMLQALPGVFCAGEMLDWEAPTGGYLLTACFASGRVAGLGAAAWLRERAGAARPA
ncbi:TIGR03862 family flavoprotein [Eleftheria terrae]|uniref:TIGR03862 family flavoprotein n=1 Tax=Eleftheria terrae TaxID=1597781 RepID=UPI00263AA58C|nr:TIGR03862 family flavoprotein [Eleftheria terrae]WKB51272.1 TIGR03862 family flavoprotein [Eleftheria terrae]